MSTKKESIEINGNKYLCVQWDAEKAYLMKFRIIKVLGESITGLVAAMGSDDKNQITAIAKSIQSFFSNSKPEEVLSLLKDVVCSCYRIQDDERTLINNFAGDFAGDLMTPYKIFAFVLKVNYSDFLGGSEAISKVMGKLA